MPFIHWIDEPDATGELAQCYADYFQRRPDRTKVADVLKCFSHRPDLLKHVMEFSWQVHFSDGHLTERVKEMLATLVSGQNRCPYCMNSHAFFLADKHKVDDQVVGAIGRGEIDTAQVTPAERELLRFAHKITHESYRNTPEGIQRLRDAGWTEPQIAEAAYTVALFAFFNRIANSFGLDAPQYHAIAGKPNPLAGAVPPVGTAPPVGTGS
jgi:uncharacterized peroxidase-related enzyme